MKTLRPTLRLATLLSLAVSSLHAQSVTSITVGKTEYYRQTHALPVTTATTADLDTSNSYGSGGFKVTVQGTGLSAPTVTLASGSNYNTANPTEHNGGVLVLNSDGAWGYGRSSGFGIAAPTPLQNSVENLNTYFSNNSYTVSVPTVGSVALTLGGAGNANPALPGVSFNQGSWSGGKFVFDPTQALTITTTAYAQFFTGGAGVGGHADLWVNSNGSFLGYEEEHFSRIAPSGTSTEETLGNTTINYMTHTFAANTFVAGQDYDAGASFARIMAQDTSIAGSFSVSYFERENAFTLSAIPEPSTYAMFAGLGACLAVAIKRRRTLGLALWRRRQARLAA